jgi:hypothetical protein
MLENPMPGPVSHPIHHYKSRTVEQSGVNAHGEVLEAGRVPDCYLGLPHAT